MRACVVCVCMRALSECVRACVVYVCVCVCVCMRVLCVCVCACVVSACVHVWNKLSDCIRVSERASDSALVMAQTSFIMLFKKYVIHYSVSPGLNEVRGAHHDEQQSARSGARREARAAGRAPREGARRNVRPDAPN